jgi:hypothetical protein
MGEAATTDIPPRTPFALLPESLAGIQLRGRGGEAFQVDALSGPIRQAVFEHGAPMERDAIPAPDHATRHRAEQMLLKDDPIGRVAGAVLAVNVPRARWGCSLRAHPGGRPWARERPQMRRCRRGLGPGLAPPVEGRPGVLLPAAAGRVVPVVGVARWLWRTPGERVAQAADMAGGDETPHARWMTAAIRPRGQSWPRKP